MLTGKRGPCGAHAAAPLCFHVTQVPRRLSDDCHERPSSRTEIEEEPISVQLDTCTQNPEFGRTHTLKAGFDRWTEGPFLLSSSIMVSRQLQTCQLTAFPAVRTSRNHPGRSTTTPHFRCATSSSMCFSSCPP